MSEISYGEPITTGRVWERRVYLGKKHVGSIFKAFDGAGELIGFFYRIKSSTGRGDVFHTESAVMASLEEA